MPMPNYDGRVFVSLENTENGEVDERTRFAYHQNGFSVWADYAGGDIVRGHLVGTTDEDGRLHFLYHHLNTAGELRAGECNSIPQKLPDGRLRLRETWRWLNGYCSAGTSIIEEQAPDNSGVEHDD